MLVRSTEALLMAPMFSIMHVTILSFTLLLGLLELFILSFIIHCFFKIFGGKGSYKQTIGVYAYSMVTFIFLPIPLMGIIAGFYALYIIARGGEIKHNLSLGKSIAAVTLSVLVPLLLFGGLFVAAIGMMRG